MQKNKPFPVLLIGDRMHVLNISSDDIERVFFENHEDFETIDEGEWVQEHKYQFCEVIVKQLSTERFFRMDVSRSGSYHSDWYYDFSNSELVEVVKTTRTIVVEEWLPA